jgi:hypothetical protein
VEPHVCEVANRTDHSLGEYVAIANGGVGTVALTGLMLSDYTSTQQEVHLYRFPSLANGSNLVLSPGQYAFVFTGFGTDQLDSNGNWLLFMGRAASIWNNDGDVAYLRRLDGTFVDSRTVGDPKRHPNGH